MESQTVPNGALRTIYRTPEFDYFYLALPGKVQTVYNVSTKFVKHLENTDLYELRVSVGTNEYRTILFAIDHDNFIEAKKIILLNGFLKKSSKDYKKQIEIAQTILNSLRK